MSQKNFEYQFSAKISALRAEEDDVKVDGIETIALKVKKVLGEENEYNATLETIKQGFKLYQMNTLELQALLENTKSGTWLTNQFLPDESQTFGDRNYELLSKVALSNDKLEKAFKSVKTTVKKLNKLSPETMLSEEESLKAYKKYQELSKSDKNAPQAHSNSLTNKPYQTELDKGLGKLSKSMVKLLDSTVDIMSNLKNIDKQLFEENKFDATEILQ